MTPVQLFSKPQRTGAWSRHFRKLPKLEGHSSKPLALQRPLRETGSLGQAFTEGFLCNLEASLNENIAASA